MIAKYRQQGVEGWVLTNFTMEQVEGRIKNLENKLAAKEAELEQEKESRRGNKQAVVDTVGGLVEGKPTNILNYLQRLRELMNKEMELSIERKALKLACIALDIDEEAQSIQSWMEQFRKKAQEGK